jgi:GPN-loop GTPase
MQNYQLGPNGALILAADLLATRINDIEESIDSLNPDFAIFDSPGQIELFAYRNSGPYIVNNIKSDAITVLFLFDSTLVSSPSHFVSISLLSASIALRLRTPQIGVLSRKDLLGPGVKQVMKWSTDAVKLEEALYEESKGSVFQLSSTVLRSLARSGFSHELIPVSSTTREGMIELSAAISRQLNQGEEIED